MNGVIDLIAQSPAAKATNLTPREMAELIFAVNDGMLMRNVLKIGSTTQERREQQLKVARNLWRLLFKERTKPAYACRGKTCFNGGQSETGARNDVDEDWGSDRLRGAAG